MPIVSKKPAVTRCRYTRTRPLGPGTTWSSTNTLTAFDRPRSVSGRMDARATPSTNGNDPRTSVTRSPNCRTAWGSYRDGGSCTDMVSKLCRSTPGSMVICPTKLRTINPAPMRITSARPTCATTMAFRAFRNLPRPSGSSAPRDTPRNISAARVSVTVRAGINPKATPVTSDSTTVNQSTLASIAIDTYAGIEIGFTAKMNSFIHSATNSPRAPPTEATIKLSVRRYCTMRPRPAPRAWRSASSLRRDKSLAMRKFATLAHAISSTSPAATSRNTAALCASPSI